MKILIGKFGKSIIFDENRWGAIGGDNEAPTLFLKMAEMHPENTYYILGRSNFSKMNDEFKQRYSNIFDLWDNFNSKKDNFTTWPYLRANELGLTFDFGIFYSGPASRANIKNFLFNKRDPNTKAHPYEMMYKYVSPLVYFLNMTSVKYVMLTVDSRYSPFRSEDLYNRPIKVLSQIDKEVMASHIPDLPNMRTYIKTPENLSYDGIETVMLMNSKRFDINNLNKNIKMMIVLNEGGNGAPLRGPMLKEYVLDNFEDVDVYGKWSEEWHKDPRFKGSKRFVELQEMLSHVKYTFIIPIQKGWVTAKFWEMANYGILPFMHPYYDSQKHIKCPDFLRVKNPKELMERIQYLEDHSDFYKVLLQQLHDILLDSYYDGSFMMNVIDETIKKYV